MEKNSAVGRLWKLLVLEKQEISSIYFYAILIGLVQLSIPIGVQAIIGFVMGASMVTSIYVLIIIVVIGVLMVGVMQINQMKIIEKIQQNIFARYAFEFTETIPRLDLQKVDNYYLPEKVNRFFDTITVQKGMSKILLDIPTATIQILFGLILLSLYHPVFIVFGILLVFILWVILKISSKDGLATSMQESNYKYDVVAWLQEMARVIKSFKFSQGTQFNLQKMDANVLGYVKARTAHFKILVFQYQSLVAFKVTITSAMLIVGAYLLIHQQLNIGEFIAAEIVILTVIVAVEKLISNLDSVYDVITGLEKLASVTESSLEQDGKLDFTGNYLNTNIQLIDFSFTYPDGKKALQNINLDIPANSTVCVSGVEGSGKTTLLKLLGSNYLDFTGSFMLNNIPIRSYNLQAIRSHTGMYLNLQDLFKGSLLENISMGRKYISTEKILETAEHLGMKNFLTSLPFGLETHIDPLGRKLASTMIKKILLLRVFANEPFLLILEEPWLSLEEPIKTNMQTYLLGKHRNATVIIATNDLSFAKQCDYHIMLENGLATILKYN